MFPILMGHLRVARRGPGRPRTRPDRVRGDKAYSSRAIRRHLRERGIVAVIPEPADPGHQVRQTRPELPRWRRATSHHPLAQEVKRHALVVICQTIALHDHAGLLEDDQSVASQQTMPDSPARPRGFRAPDREGLGERHRGTRGGTNFIFKSHHATTRARLGRAGQWVPLTPVLQSVVNSSPI